MTRTNAATCGRLEPCSTRCSPAGARSKEKTSATRSPASSRAIPTGRACLPTCLLPLRTLIRRCLVKDRRERLSEIATAKFVLSEWGNLIEPGAAREASAAPAASRGSRRQWVLPVVATALTAAVVGAGAWALRSTPRPPVVARFSIAPDGGVFSGTPVQVVAVSPDGTRLAYSANRRIYVRSIDELDARAVTDTILANTPVPVFAPDGESIVLQRSPRAALR